MTVSNGRLVWQDKADKGGDDFASGAATDGSGFSFLA
jgi:hypothetical protein